MLAVQTVFGEKTLVANMCAMDMLYSRNGSAISKLNFAGFVLGENNADVWSVNVASYDTIGYR